MTTLFKILILVMIHYLPLFGVSQLETHVVGDDNGWTLNFNYTNWASGRSFHVGDALVFNYQEGIHNVVQVNESSYGGCIKDPNLGAYKSGNDTLNLDNVGQLWYICGVGNHCQNGQKLNIQVVD